MKKTIKKIAVLVLAIAVFAMALPMAMADGFVGYNCITTKEQLNDVRNSLGAKYYLGNDIVFTEADFAPGGAFITMARAGSPSAPTEATLSTVFLMATAIPLRA